MTEREAEIVGAAFGIALLVLESARPETGLSMKGIGPDAKLVLVLDIDDGENLACESAIFCGVPCTKHHNKQVRNEDAAAGQLEGMKFLSSVRSHIDDFDREYRREQVKNYSTDNPFPMKGGDNG